MSNIKSKIIKIFKMKFLRNEDLSEVAIAKYDLNYLLAILDEYGSFYEFEKEIGYLGRHSREREKYALFLTVLERFQEIGPDALRPKNIEDDLMEQIKKYYGSLSNLTKKIILEPSEESVLFVAHSNFMKGITIDQFENKCPNLHKEIIQRFESLFNFSAVYQKKLFLNPVVDFNNSPLSLNEQKCFEAAKKYSIDDVINNLVHYGLEDADILTIQDTDLTLYYAIEFHKGIRKVRSTPEYSQVCMKNKNSTVA